MFVVDTNILLYAADGDSPNHAVCRNLLETWRRQRTPWYLTWGIVYEFLRVSTHPNVFRNPFSARDASRFLMAVLASPSLGLLTETSRHEAILSEMIEALPALRGNLMFDAHVVALMREHGIRTIYTHDADFHRFPDLTVTDPTQ